MSKLKHASLPWHTCPAPDAFWIEDARGNDVATCDVANVTAKDEDNAAFIVHAVNNHQAMLEALEAAERHIGLYADLFADDDPDTIILRRLRDAIAKAKDTQ